MVCVYLLLVTYGRSFPKLCTPIRRRSGPRPRIARSHVPVGLSTASPSFDVIAHKLKTFKS